MKQQLLDAFKTAGNMTMNKTVMEHLMQLEDTFQHDSQFYVVFHITFETLQRTTHKYFVKILEIPYM